MDPLSIIASAITVLAVGGKAAKVITHLALLKTAPDIVLALNNELIDLRLVITAIEAVFQTQKTSGISFQGHHDHEADVQASLISSIEQVNKKALELEVLYDKLVPNGLEPNSSVLKNIPKHIWILEQRNIKRVHRDLRSLRLKLVAAVGVLNSASLHRLERGIHDLNFKLSDLKSDQASLKPAFRQSFTQHNKVIEDLQTGISDLQSTQHALRVFHDDAWNQQQAVLHKSIPQISAAQQRMELKIDMIEVSMAATAACALPASPVQSRLSGSSHTIRTTYVSSSNSLWKCIGSCGCVCHTPSSVKLPSFLNRFLGALFIGYSGVPRITPPCDVKACVERSSLSATATYSFPSWLLARAMYIAVTLSGSDGPQFTLRVSRSTSRHTAILHRSRAGDVDSLKEILSQRIGSPFDFDDVGNTALMYAARNSMAEACKILLSVGADPWQRTPTGRCAYDCAWDAIAYRTGDAVSRQELGTLFPGNDISDRWRSTLLHKTLFGFTQLDLAEVVRNLSPAEINEVDGLGRTATWWAARRGDASALSLLLKHGGDGNKPTPGGTLPFEAALTSSEPACYRLFLEPSFGVSVVYTNSGGYTALHNCCFYSDDVDFVRCLVDRGADVNARANDGMSPLHYAAQQGRKATVDHLISRGANINTKAATGETPLHLAIEDNRHGSIRLLLDHNPDYTLETVAGETVLHCLAHFADRDTLKLFRGVDLSAISLESRVKAAAPGHLSNITGLTACEVAEHRQDVDSEWMNLFQEVVAGVVLPELKGYADDPPEGNGAFEDALEFQS